MKPVQEFNPVKEITTRMYIRAVWKRHDSNGAYVPGVILLWTGYDPT
jgi:hypothetical protein